MRSILAVIVCCYLELKLLWSSWSKVWFPELGEFALAGSVWHFTLRASIFYILRLLLTTEDYHEEKGMGDLLCYARGSRRCSAVSTRPNTGISMSSLRTGMIERTHPPSSPSHALPPSAKTITDDLPASLPHTEDHAPTRYTSCVVKDRSRPWPTQYQASTAAEPHAYPP